MAHILHEVTTKENLVYRESNSKMCDVYSAKSVLLPESKLPPIVIAISGGAWTIGNKSRLSGVAQVLCQNLGITCVVPEYSLSRVDQNLIDYALCFSWTLFAGLLPNLRTRRKILKFCILFFGICLAGLTFVGILNRQKVKKAEESRIVHPLHANDIATCIQWVVKNSGHVNAIVPGDATRIFLLGHSAGAHLACLVTLNMKFLDDDTRSRILGVVCLSGVYSFWQLQKSITRHFINREVFAETGVGLTEHSYEKHQLQTKQVMEEKQCQCSACVKFRTRWTNVEDAWPLFHIKSLVEEKSEIQNAPSFFVVTSDLDLSLLNHAVDFVAKLKQCSYQCQHVHFALTNHFSIRKHWNGKHAHIAQAVMNFIKHLS